MASLQIKQASRIFNRCVSQIIRKTTDSTSRGTSVNIQTHLHTGVCMRHVKKLEGCLLSARSGVWACRQGRTSEWRRVAMIEVCHSRSYTTEAESLESKPSRLLSEKFNPGKKRGRSQTVRDDLNAAAYMVGDSINLRQLRILLKEQGLYKIVTLPEDIKDAMMATAIYKVDAKVRDFYCFGDGRVACWNMPENERTEVLKTVLRCTDLPFSLTDIMKEEELQPVTYHTDTRFANSTIHLKTQEENNHEEDMALQKFAFSDAMGQTVMLSFCERKLEAFTSKIEPEIQKLRNGQPSRMLMKDINKNRGEVFLLRHEINLESDLLDTPDIYWEREDLEGLYNAMVVYYNVRLRILTFNERLNYCSDFLELLVNQHNDAKHVFLEKVIIVLIMIEVVFGGVPFLQEYVLPLFSSGASDVVQQASDVTQVTDAAQIAEAAKTKTS